MLFKKRKCEYCRSEYDPALHNCPTCNRFNQDFVRNKVSRNVFYFHPIIQIALFIIGFRFGGMLASQYIFAFLMYELPRNDFTNVQFELLVYTSMLAGLLIAIFLTRRKLFFSRFKRPMDYLYGIGYAITVLAAGTFISALLSSIHPVGNNANQEGIINLTTAYPFLMFIIVCLIGPVCEELTYRVGLYSFLRRINKYLAFAVTVIVFALIHFDFAAQGDDLINELWALPTYLVSGFVLTLAYEHRGPACSIIAHALYNSIAFVLTLVATHG